MKDNDFPTYFLCTPEFLALSTYVISRSQEGIRQYNLSKTLTNNTPQHLDKLLAVMISPLPGELCLDIY